MPTHYSNKNKNNKMMPLKKLTQKQKDKLKKHSVHHTQKHMRSMRMAMMRGQSFDKAHKDAMAKVGK